MSGTPLSEIYDLFMMNITDYRLVSLFNTSSTDFETYLQPWLEDSISDFKVCDQDLTFDDTLKEFSLILTRENKGILSYLMVKHWLEKNVSDITQMNLHITDRDFKVASEAMNLREKVGYLDDVKERCSQMLIDYAYSKVNWSDWFNQNFQGS